MEKVKLKLPWLDARHISDRLGDIITDYNHKAPKADKLFACLWLQIYLKITAKTAFKYSGDKTYTISIAHAVAFEMLLHQWIKNNEETDRDEYTDYRYNLYRSLASFIDQETA